MNTLQSALYPQYYVAPGDTHQPVAISSSQTQHPHPDTLRLSLLSRNAIIALRQIEHQPNGDDQPMTDAQRENVEKTREVALQARIGIGLQALYLVPNESEDAHYQQIVFLSEKEFANATLTVRVRLNEQAEYDLVGIDRHEPSSGERISIVVSEPPQPANTYAPTAQMASPVSANNAQVQLAEARTYRNIAPKGTLTRNSIESHNPQVSSESALPITIKATRCKHDSRAIISQTTFVGCYITEDELNTETESAKKRVNTRRRMHKKAQLLGIGSTAEVTKKEQEDRAIARGFPNLKIAQQTARRNLAEERGFPDLKTADATARDFLASKNNTTRQKASQLARDKRARDRGFTDHNHAMRVKWANKQAEKAAEAAEAAEANNV